LSYQIEYRREQEMSWTTLTEVERRTARPLAFRSFAEALDYLYSDRDERLRYQSRIRENAARQEAA
jgi:hypothetical protein